MSAGTIPKFQASVDITTSTKDFSITYPTGGGATAKSLIEGVYADMIAVVAELNTQLQAVAAHLTASLGDTDGKVIIESSDANFDLTWTDSELRDLFAYGSTTYTNQSSITSADQAKYQLYPIWPYEDDPEDIDHETFLEVDGRRRVAVTYVDDAPGMSIILTLRAADEDYWNDFFKWICQGRRFRFYRNRDDNTAWSTSNRDGYSDLVLKPGPRSMEWAPINAPIKKHFRQELRCLVYQS